MTYKSGTEVCSQGSKKQINRTLFTNLLYTDEQRTWLKAIQRYKEENHKDYLRWDEVLAIALSLGYRKVLNHS